MACPRQSRTENTIIRYLSDDLGRLGRWRLRRHLARCPLCRAAYDRAVLAERAMAEGSLHLEAHRAWERFHHGPHYPQGSARPFPLARPLALGAALAAACLALVLLVPPSDPPLTPKGTIATPQALEAGMVAYLLEPGEANTIAPIRREGRVSLQGVLKLTVTNRGPQPLFAFIFGLDDRGQPRWYVPHYDQAASIEVPPQTADHPVGQGIKLWVNHVPGPLRIYALFTQWPLTRQDVENKVARMFSKGRDSLPAPEEWGHDGLMDTIDLTLY